MKSKTTIRSRLQETSTGNDSGLNTENSKVNAKMCLRYFPKVLFRECVIGLADLIGKEGKRGI